MSIVFFALAPPIMRIFMDDPEVVRQGTLALRVICLGYVFFGFGMVISQAFNGAGDTWTPTLWNFIVFWIIQIPLAYLLSQWWGAIGVYISIAVCSSLIAVILIWLFRKGQWAHIEV